MKLLYVQEQFVKPLLGSSLCTTSFTEVIYGHSNFPNFPFCNLNTKISELQKVTSLLSFEQQVVSPQQCPVRHGHHAGRCHSLACGADRGGSWHDLQGLSHPYGHPWTQPCHHQGPGGALYGTLKSWCLIIIIFLMFGGGLIFIYMECNARLFGALYVEFCFSLHTLEFELYRFCQLVLYVWFVSCPGTWIIHRVCFVHSFM